MLTVATAIFGPGYELHEPSEAPIDCRFLCFTDRTDLHSLRWKIQLRNQSWSARRSNRNVKTLLHRYIDGPTLYVDAEFKLTADPHAIIGTALESNRWAATRHPVRDCLFAEAAFCLEKGCVSAAAELRAQVKRYRAAGMPEHWGLWAGGILARRGDAESARLGEAWWGELERGAERDQVALPFVAWRLELLPGEIPGVYTALPGIVRRKRKRA